MFWLKACGHCGGDLYQERDLHGEYVSCLQCGNYLSAKEQATLRRRLPAQRGADACHDRGKLVAL